MLPKDLTELDLLLDDTFLQYIRRNDDGAVEKWETYIAQHPEIREKVAAAVELYYNINTSEAETDKAVQLTRLQQAIKSSGSGTGTPYPLAKLRLARGSSYTLPRWHLPALEKEAPQHYTGYLPGVLQRMGTTENADAS